MEHVLFATEEVKMYDLTNTHLTLSIKFTSEIIHFFPGDKLVDISPQEKWKAKEEKAPQILNVFFHIPSIY